MTTEHFYITDDGLLLTSNEWHVLHDHKLSYTISIFANNGHRVKALELKYLIQRNNMKITDIKVSY